VGVGNLLKIFFWGGGSYAYRGLIKLDDTE
jgi:hypothetical protein